MSENSVKMFLPGESPWGEVIEYLPDGTARLRIANRLLPEWTDAERLEFAARTNTPVGWMTQMKDHGYREGQIVHCRKDGEVWFPVAA